VWVLQDFGPARLRCDEEKTVYQEKFPISGEIGPHKFDFSVPPNGAPGMALQILSAQSTHTAARAEAATIVTPETRLAWHRRLIAQKI
jgi:hypothetical protein